VWRDALVVAGKDLRVESRSKVALNQVVPYSLVVLLLFGFAFDQDQPLLVQAAPGLFWLAVLFSGLLAVQRTFSIESADGAADSLRMSGLEPAGIFVGKVVAVAVQLLLLEVFLAVGIVVLFHSKLEGAGLLAASAVLSTIGVAAAGVAYGALSMGTRVRETLLPLLLAPVLAPVVLAATEAWRAALGFSPGGGWRWARPARRLHSDLPGWRSAELWGFDGGNVRYPQASGSSRLTRVLGWSALAALALNTWWGLWLSPPDVVQGQFVRMLYIHPAVATMCYAGFGVCALGSIAWLWPRLRSPRWDRLAVAGAEVGAVFCFATLVTGSIWGRASWGVWWTWDARLTLTAILFALSLGYLALRRSIDNPALACSGVVDGGGPDGLDRRGRPLRHGMVRHPPPARDALPAGSQRCTVGS
jgi:heme exporter protein B